MLIGLPGTGKSECAKLTAELLGWSFGDTDKWIEAAYGGSIAQMFEREGEPFFRELERLTLGELEVDRVEYRSLNREELEKAWKDAMRYSRERESRLKSQMQTKSESSGTTSGTQVADPDDELPKVYQVFCRVAQIIEQAKQEAEQKGGLVLATGGGMPVPSYNQEIISSLGHAFYLSCDLEVLAARLAGDCSRPLLKGSNQGSSGDKKGGFEGTSPLDDSQKDATLKRLQELLNNRRSAYGIAGEEIDTTFMTPGEVADKLKDSITAKINM